MTLIVSDVVNTVKRRFIGDLVEGKIVIKSYNYEKILNNKQYSATHYQKKKLINCTIIIVKQTKKRRRGKHYKS